MKGVILAGGTGSRLHPLTRITNKHLLPVYDKPMIFYPIETLVSAGIDEIMVVTGGNHAGEFLPLLGNGSEFGLRRLQFSYQAQAGGIAEALVRAGADVMFAPGLRGVDEIRAVCSATSNVTFAPVERTRSSSHSCRALHSSCSNHGVWHSATGTVLPPGDGDSSYTIQLHV